jgi:hypothetical protein
MIKHRHGANMGILSFFHFHLGMKFKKIGDEGLLLTKG